MLQTALADISCQGSYNDTNDTDDDKTQQAQIGHIAIENNPRCFLFRAWLKTQHAKVGPYIETTVLYKRSLRIEPYVSKESAAIGQSFASYNVFMDTCFG